MSIFDTLFGISDAHVNAPQMNTQAGTAALRQQARNMSGQLGAQQYGLAAGARGSSSALALREAQRRSMQGQQAIGAQTVAQQGQLEQQAASANQQAQLAANQANANIEMQNDQAFSRGLGGLIATGATAAMFMSDKRAKENVRPMYSDFVLKEQPGRFSGVDFQEPQYAVPVEVGARPAPARAMIPIRPEPSRGAMPADPYAESRAAFGLDRAQRPTTTLADAAVERATIDEVRSPVAQYIPQQVRPGVRPEELTNEAAARHFRDRREARELEEQTAREVADPQYNPLLLSLREYGRGMASDKRAKEAAFSQGMRLGAMRSSMAPAYAPVMPPPGYRPMPSDFRQKEMSADESRRALAPVQPVEYQYREGPSARMAAETGTTPEERAMVYADKRTPRAGIFAQDLQKSPAFRSSVMNTPAGLAVERDRALSTNLAATAGLDKRVTELEEENDELRRVAARALGRGPTREQRDRMNQEYSNAAADQNYGDAAGYMRTTEGDPDMDRKERARRFLRSQIAPRIDWMNGLRQRDEVLL